MQYRNGLTYNFSRGRLKVEEVCLCWIFNDEKGGQT